MTTATTIAAPPTCEGIVGHHPGEYGERPIPCSASVGITQWTDLSGRMHRACRHHLAALLRRNPQAAEPYVSERADDPLGQMKAAQDR